ncbi:MAG: FAD-dependent oxidoreductase, partial [Rhodoferax sp.]|nr:FAD-dependent oxidoreductase [Rhodoferax sp.]
YYDGQFDDARLAVNLLQTAQQFGAVAANRIAVTKIIHDGVRASGAMCRCEETQQDILIHAKVVVNATGIFADSIRRMDDPKATIMIEPAQGVHLVLPKSFLAGDTAIMVPHTDDGRVLFVIPWHDRVIVGTTDTPMKVAEIEPKPLDEEIGFILRNASRYLQREPTRADVLSVFAGQRPLVHAGGTDGGASKKVSREHVVQTKMAEEAVNAAVKSGALASAPCQTEKLLVHGASQNANAFAQHPEWLRCYGSDADALVALMKAQPNLAAPLHARLPYSMVVVAWAARMEQARTLEDVLSRRTRSLLLDAKAALECSAVVAQLLADELGHDRAWAAEQT